MLNILITIMMCILIGMAGFIGYDVYVLGNLDVAGYFMVGVTIFFPVAGFNFGLIWQ